MNQSDNVTYKIILASRSAQRQIMMKAILASLNNIGYDYEVSPADIDELSILAHSQLQRVELIASAKGRKVVNNIHDQENLVKKYQKIAVLSADTYLIDENHYALEKPKTIKEAQQMLRYQSGKSITAITGAYFAEIEFLKEKEVPKSKANLKSDQNLKIDLGSVQKLIFKSKLKLNSKSPKNLKVSEKSAVYETKVTFRNLSEQEIDCYTKNEPVLTFSGSFSPAYPAGATLIKKINGSFTGFSHGFPVEFFLPKLQKFLL
jgi:predicted house-cleaning NTP pyrophosphatase (Maf/HAM1 superfamily)